MIPKPWQNSKTIWFAIAYAVIAWGPAVLAAVGFGDWTPPAALVEWVNLLLPVIVAALRKLTTQPIA